MAPRREIETKCHDWYLGGVLYQIFTMTVMNACMYVHYNFDQIDQD